MNRVVLLCLLAGGCKSKPAPAPSVDASASASASPFDAAASPTTALVDAATPKPRHVDRGFVDTVVVSSRVDNDTESPRALVDHDPDTAWSSRTGDMVGAWIALRVRGTPSLRGVRLTVGMTKDDDLFVQNPRISEVSISFAPAIREAGVERTEAATTLVTSFPLDTESKRLQTVPFTAVGPGVLKIVVTKVRAGSRASWREVSISDMDVFGAGGDVDLNPGEVLVGSFAPQPRGTLGVVPERPLPFGCLAAAPEVPRVYCVVGTWSLGSIGTRDASLVTLEPNRRLTLADLTGEPNGGPMLDYGVWLRAEQQLRRGRTLSLAAKGPAGAASIPWQGSVDAGGATFRQRETKREHEETPVGSWDEIQGVVEVKWPGASDFVQILGEAGMVATSPMQATVAPIGTLWLVERTMQHGSEGVSAAGAEATLCDVGAKACVK